MHEWSTAIATYLLWLDASGSSKDTIRVRRSYITRLSKIGLDPWQVTTENLIEWMHDQGWKSAQTKKCARSSLRSFYEWASATGRIQTSPAAALPRVKVPQGKPRPTPDHVVKAAWAMAGKRERLMILLGVKGGLRRAEISQVRGTDLLDGDMLHIVGKGGRERMVPILHPDLLEALHQAGPNYLFPGNDNGHISPWWTGTLLSRLLGPGWTGHTLRHKAGTKGYKGTHDIRAVQEFLGHASVKWTELYTAIDDDDLRAVAQAAA